MATGIFRNPSEGMDIPNPKSVVSAMGLLNAVGKIPSFGALSPLFMVSDVLSTQVVHEMLNDFSETSLLAWEQAKQGGLNQALAYAQNSQGAKKSELAYRQDISQEQYEKLIINKVCIRMRFCFSEIFKIE